MKSTQLQVLQSILKELKDVRWLLQNTDEFKRNEALAPRTQEKPENIIDCDKDPKIPYDNWKVESHTKMGMLDWDKIKPELYLSDKQKGGYINGKDLRKELEDKNPLNANVLDYLLENLKLIPSDWKGKWIYFWGTIYRDSDDGLYVRCLCVDDGGSCSSDYDWIGVGFYAGNPALVAGKYSSLNSESLNQHLDTLDFEIETITMNGRKYKLVEE